MNEHQQIEWKASWRDDYLKWLCGFANAQGGVLEIGRNDKGQIEGIPNATRLMEELPNKLRDLLGIVADIDLQEEDGKRLMRITVDPYPVPISYRGKYHFRSGSTKQILKGAALDRFLLGKFGKKWDGVPVPGVSTADLDAGTFAVFRKKATRSKRLEPGALDEDDASLFERLRLKEGFFLKRAAILLFHDDPERFFTGAFLKIGYFASNSDVRYHDEVTGNLFEQVDRTIDLMLTKYLKAGIGYEGIQRIETFPVPENALREVLLNALVHRDYSVPAPVQIKVFPDRLSIWNPCTLPDDWSKEKLLQHHSSMPFNPDIARTFFRAGDIEMWGRGIERVMDSCREAATPMPGFHVDSRELRVVFPFSAEYLRSIDAPRSVSNHNSGYRVPTQETTQETTQEQILSLLRANPRFTRKALSERIGITPDGFKYHLNRLRKAGVIRHVGPTKKGRWEISNEV